MLSTLAKEGVVLAVVLLVRVPSALVLLMIVLLGFVIVLFIMIVAFGLDFKQFFRRVTFQT